MKLLKNILLMTAVAGSLFVSSCKPDAKTTTTTTPTSKTGTLKCKVNGVAWESLPNGNTMYFVGTDTVYGTNAVIKNGEISINSLSIVNKDTSAIGFHFVLTPNKTGTYSGTYVVGSNDYAFYFPSADNLTAMTVALTYTNTYSVTLTKVDEVNNLVSGVFTITELPPSGSTDPFYKITEGTFTDVKVLK